MLSNYFQKPTNYKKTHPEMEICQIKLHELYAILQKVVPGTNTTTRQYIFPTCTIVYPCLYLMEVTEVKQIPENVCNINQARKYIQRRNICITDYHHDLSLTQ